MTTARARGHAARPVSAWPPRTARGAQATRPKIREKRRCHNASPDGQLYPNIGCDLEVVPNERLVWTDALLPGYRPSPEPFFTAAVLLEPDGKGGTNYTAIAMHRDEDGRKKHEAMGFHEGWGQVYTQMIEFIQSTKL